MTPALTTSADNLDAFWRRTIERARQTPLDARVEPARNPAPHHTFRVTYQSLDGVPVRAYLGVPADTAPPAAGWPAVVTAPGYGGWEFGCTLSECQRGCVVLQVYPRGQGESGELWQVRDGAYQAWVNHGKEDREGFYYQGAYADLVRGVDFLLTRPDVDAKRIAAMSTSQGGLLALGLAAVDARVRVVVAHVPYLCDALHNPALADSLGRDDAFLSTWDSFDPVRLAPRIKAPALLSSGGRDATCPPETIRAVFDALGGIKALAHFPELTHTSSADFYAQSWEWLGRYLFRI